MEHPNLFPELTDPQASDLPASEPPARERRANKSLVKAQPQPSMRELFASPQLTDPDDARLYNVLLTALEVQLRPGENPILWIAMGDFAYWEMEVRRLRRAKATLISLQEHRAAREILEPGFADLLAQPQRYVGDWPAPGPLDAANARNAGRGLPGPDAPDYHLSADEAVRLATAELESRGAPPSSLQDQAFLLVLDDIERIERLHAGAISERNRAQSSFERQTDRQAVQRVTEIPDGEFE
jgi:hypothetical protein